MNARHISPLAIAMAVALTACGNGSETGSSTPIDSTNMSGVAPAQYSEGTSGPTIDTTIHRHDSTMADTNGRAALGPQGMGANTSNTTDRRTTSGSANSGDADGDRKK